MDSVSTNDQSEFTAHRALACSSRAELLKLLRDTPRPMTIVELSKATGLHANTVREHLNILIASHFVTREADSGGGRGRPRLTYTAANAVKVPSPRSAQETDSLELLCRVLSANAARGSFGSSTWEHVQQSATDWVREHGQHLPNQRVETAADAIDVITAILAERGFSPAPDVGRQHVVLHACPYSELALEQQQVVCGAHLGLLLGALEQMGSPVKARFSEINPNIPRCVVQIVEPPAIREDQL